MPICDSCAREADMYVGESTFLVDAAQRWHNPEQYGHRACRGGTHCYCQHKNHGAWRGE